MLRSEQVAREDAALHGHAFSSGTRAVIRWIKGDGRDDAITRTAIAQATRLFGAEVDYCLCTHGIGTDRVRDILAWSAQPVEWMPVTAADHPALATALRRAGCSEDRFGYWWKWFPERVRPDGPEWILDGDMVVVARPDWFDEWLRGTDVIRVAQDDRSVAAGAEIFGWYGDLIDGSLALYSGLVSLPPGASYSGAMLDVMKHRPLVNPHDGIYDMSEQGVASVAFQDLGATPIPLHEFPFARAYEPHLDFGLDGDQGRAWGYHFGNSFRRDNPHFERMSEEGWLFRPDGEDGWGLRRLTGRRRRAARRFVDRYRWLAGGRGQWGVPGWAMPEGCVEMVAEHGARFAGRDVLDLGTSRGRVAAMLCEAGCRVTTVDVVDRGASQNLEGLPIEVVTGDAVEFMQGTNARFDLIVVDVHGNTPGAWKRLGPALKRCLRPGGSLLLSNVELWKIPEWVDETGAWEFVGHLGAEWKVRSLPSGPPGMVIARRR